MERESNTERLLRDYQMAQASCKLVYKAYPHARHTCSLCYTRNENASKDAQMAFETAGPAALTQSMTAPPAPLVKMPDNGKTVTARADPTFGYVGGG
jgi:hypothetical protein